MKVTQMTSEVTEAIRTLNRAVEKNSGNPVFGQLRALSEKVADGLTVAVGIYKDDASHPHDYYTVAFKDGSFELLSHGKSDDAQVSWNLSEEYIESLANDPERYIDNPLLIDWDWIKQKL